MTKPFAAADGCRDFAFAAVLNALLGRCLLVYHLLERHVLPRHIVFLLAVRKKSRSTANQHAETFCIYYSSHNSNFDPSN